MQGAEEEQEDAGPSCSSQAPGFVEAFIEVRIHKLQQRQFFLQKMQQVIQRAQDTQHDDGDVSELELVEKELEELMRQKQSLIPQSPLYTGMSPALSHSIQYTYFTTLSYMSLKGMGKIWFVVDLVERSDRELGLGTRTDSEADGQLLSRWE
uniref:Uncharacterized protein n=1 Tax=Knipowitschia caucasica TaxID=637954 RepID=A0AAV2LFG9_KNICA